MNRVAPSAVLADPIPARAGVGLRFPHHGQALAGNARAAWFEVHPENYLGAAGDILEQVRQGTPISLHATGLSLGSAEGVDDEHLNALAQLCRRIEPGLVSDHLSWSSSDGIFLPDLLPLPYTSEAQDIFAANIAKVQDALGRAILIENPSVYLSFADNEMSEGEFLAGLVRRTGCGLLLDVNNVAVSAANLGEAPEARLAMMLEALPAAAIGEIHLAGHAVRMLPDGGFIAIDDHGSRVNDTVWRLYDITVRRIGARPSLIEWDTGLPAFTVLADEARLADAVMHKAREVLHATAG